MPDVGQASPAGAATPPTILAVSSTAQNRELLGAVDHGYPVGPHGSMVYMF